MASLVGEIIDFIGQNALLITILINQNLIMYVLCSKENKNAKEK